MDKSTNEKKASNSCYIWDSPFPSSFFGTQSKPILNELELNEYDFSGIDLIYINTEIKWNGFRSDFYGFTIAKELRQKQRLLCPIILCSFLNNENFRKLAIKDADILKYPGHYLLRLIDKPEITTYQSVNNDTLEDICLSLFDAEQIVRNLMHNTVDALPGLIYSLKGAEKELIKEKIDNLLKKQLSLVSEKIEAGNEKKFETLCKDFINDVNSTIDSIKTEGDLLLSEAHKIMQPFDVYKPRIYHLLPKKMQEGMAEPAKLKRWQVLFIDDEPFNCLVVENHFKTNGIICQTATNAQDAFKKLKEDKSQSNRITMIIADFRLYENGNRKKGIWQDYQGYRILEEVHSNPDFKSQYVYAILTSKTGTIQKRIQKHSKFPILWFSKSDVLGGGISSFNLFCQGISKIGADAFIRKMTLPNYGGWITKVTNKVDESLNYTYLYKMHIESNDYESAEIGILNNFNSWKESFPENATLGPVFNFNRKESQKLLHLFRQTILPYRLLFLYKKHIENYNYENIFFFFNPKNKDNYENKNNRSMPGSDPKSELFQSMRTLFTSNWGFSIEKDLSIKNDTIRHQKEDELLFEENQFLIVNGIKLHQFGSTDEMAIKDFLIDIRKVDFNAHAKEITGQFIDKLDSGLSITYSEIRFLLKALKPEIMNNNVLEDAFYSTEMVNDCLYGECSHSQILRSLIETFVAEVENG